MIFVFCCVCLSSLFFCFLSLVSLFHSLFAVGPLPFDVSLFGFLYFANLSLACCLWIHVFCCLSFVSCLLLFVCCLYLPFGSASPLQPSMMLAWLFGSNVILCTQRHHLAIPFVKSWRPFHICLLYTSPSPRDRQKSRMPSSA